MRFSCYDWNSSRFHPQFSGIAERCAQQKKRRLVSQEKRKELYCNKAYSKKLNQKMQKELFSKTLELSRLKQTRKRHLDDLNFKQMMYEKRQEQIRSLRDRNNKQRQALKNNIALARQNIQTRKQENKHLLEQQSRMIDSRIEQMLQKRQQQNNNKYKRIKEGQQMGHSRVDAFYRQQNEKSLRAYRTRITQQNKLRSLQQRKIKQSERLISQMNKTAMIKREQLAQIEAEIQQLSSYNRTFTIDSRLKSKPRQFTDNSRQMNSSISQSSNLNPEQPAFGLNK